MGPLLGSELQEQLIYKTNTKANNARQIILRLRQDKILLTTDPVRFSHNQLLYFLPNQNIRAKLVQVLPDHRQTLHRIYQALVEQQGFLHFTEFAKISSGIVNKDEKEKLGLKQKELNEIIDELQRLEIIQPIYHLGSDRFVVANKQWVPTLNVDENIFQTRLNDLSFTHDFTDNLMDWLERMNLAGVGSTRLNTEMEAGSFNGFYWDAIGYSYLWGLYKAEEFDIFNPTQEKTPSVIVIESVLHRVMKKYDIAGFIARVSVLYGRIKTKDNFRIIPICFVQNIDSDALQLARQRGIMIISISEVFGTKIAEAIKTVRGLDPRNIDAEALASVLAASDASGHDGKFGSLKGYAFNFLVASIFNNQNYQCKLGWRYEVSEEKCECDVVIPVDDEYLIVCESKGRNEGDQILLGESENESDTVKKFFEKTCRIVESSTGKKVVPIFITSGEFTQEAKEYMNSYKQRKKIKRFFELRNFPRELYMDRKGLMDLFGNQQQYTEHRKILKEFFRDHKKAGENKPDESV